jgi:hypothetical protein
MQTHHDILTAVPLGLGGCPGAQHSEAATQAQLMFKDEHFLTFCRRLAWSPDGERCTH